MHAVFHPVVPLSLPDVEQIPEYYWMHTRNVYRQTIYDLEKHCRSNLKVHGLPVEFGDWESFLCTIIKVVDKAEDLVSQLDDQRKTYLSIFSKYLGALEFKMYYQPCGCDINLDHHKFINL